MGELTRTLPEGVSFDAITQLNKTCPNCGSTGLRIFYRVDNIPVHSCLLVTGKDDALAYPKGNLQLGFCDSCGFITNTQFDQSVHDYSAQYEETQGFSPRFNAFARSLARRLIEKYDIHGKTILEIGCGKGEFLTLMCELGNNRGIGIDPAFVPERNPATDGTQVEFVQDFYSDRYADIEADVICCRHTLEHIAPASQFIRLIRKAIGKRTDTLIFFEVPDVMRVLKEGAFWDLYYEHCSYFTTGSLARLFRSAGFKIDDLYLDYDDQYIMLTAYPADGPTLARLHIESDMQALMLARNAFRENCSSRINRWRTTLQQWTTAGQKVVLWGSGSKAVAFLTTLKPMDQIEYVVDINPYKQGRYMPGTGQKIVWPAFLQDYRPDVCVIMNPVYHDEIQQSLAEMNLSPSLVTV
jgi:SAM-dependent methyltransferase